MAGNVSEWVMDIYRPLSGEDVSDFRAFRGNVYRTKQLDPDGYVMEKDSLGRIKYRDVTPEENANRHNYKKSDNMGYLDEESYQNDEQKYDYGTATLINNKSRNSPIPRRNSINKYYRIPLLHGTCRRCRG